MLVSNRTAFYIWQPGNVWLHNLVVHAEPPRDKRFVRVVAVVRAKNLTDADAKVPTQFFMTASALRGSAHLSVGLSVFHDARVFVDGAHPPPAVAPCVRAPSHCRPAPKRDAPACRLDRLGLSQPPPRGEHPGRVGHVCQLSL